MRLFLSKIYGKTGLVLTMAGQGHILLRKIQAAIPDGIIPYLLLLGVRPPAADRHNVLPSMERIHQLERRTAARRCIWMVG